MSAKLALEDGSIYAGTSLGAEGEVAGEVVFNTSMTGYQEILTDPSYRGQIVTMTYPEIGNYGVNPQDIERDRPSLSGFIVRHESRIHSNYRASGSLRDYLKTHNLVGIAEIDTRDLVRRIREQGAMRGVLSTSDLNDESLVAKAKAAPGLVGRDLAQEVMPADISTWDEDVDAWTAASIGQVSDAPDDGPPPCRVYGFRDEVEHSTAPSIAGQPRHHRSWENARR